MVSSAISGVERRDACTGRALARSRFNSPRGAGYRDRRCYAACTEHLIWLQLSFRTQDPTTALSADRGPVWRPCRLSPWREGFLSAPRQHDLTGTAAALRPQPGGIDPGTVHRRSDKGRPLARCQLLASEFYENVEA